MSKQSQQGRGPCWPGEDLITGQTDLSMKCLQSGGRSRPTGYKIDFQLKASKNWELTDCEIVYTSGT